MIQYPNYSFPFPLSVCLHLIYVYILLPPKRETSAVIGRLLFTNQVKERFIQDNTKDSDAFVTIATRDLKIQPVTVYAH